MMTDVCNNIRFIDDYKIKLKAGEITITHIIPTHKSIHILLLHSQKLKYLQIFVVLIREDLIRSFLVTLLHLTDF